MAFFTPPSKAQGSAYRSMFNIPVTRFLASAKNQITGVILPIHDWEYKPGTPEFAASYKGYRDPQARDNQGHPALMPIGAFLYVHKNIGRKEEDFVSPLSLANLFQGDGVARSTDDPIIDIVNTIRDEHHRWHNLSQEGSAGKGRRLISFPGKTVVINTYATSAKTPNDPPKVGVLTPSNSALVDYEMQMNVTRPAMISDPRDANWPDYLYGDVTHPNHPVIYSTMTRSNPTNPSQTYTGFFFSNNSMSYDGLRQGPVITSEILSQRLNIFDPALYNFLVYQELVDLLVADNFYPLDLIQECCGGKANIGGTPALGIAQPMPQAAPQWGQPAPAAAPAQQWGQPAPAAAPAQQWGQPAPAAAPAQQWGQSAPAAAPTGFKTDAWAQPSGLAAELAQPSTFSSPPAEPEVFVLEPGQQPRQVPQSQAMALALTKPGQIGICLSGPQGPFVTPEEAGIIDRAPQGNPTWQQPVASAPAPAQQWGQPAPAAAPAQQWGQPAPAAAPAQQWGQPAPAAAPAQQWGQSAPAAAPTGFKTDAWAQPSGLAAELAQPSTFSSPPAEPEVFVLEPGQQPRQVPQSQAMALALTKPGQIGICLSGPQGPFVTPEEAGIIDRAPQGNPTWQQPVASAPAPAQQWGQPAPAAAPAQQWGQPAVAPAQQEGQPTSAPAEPSPFSDSPFGGPPAAQTQQVAPLQEATPAAPPTADNSMYEAEYAGKSVAELQQELNRVSSLMVNGQPGQIPDAIARLGWLQSQINK